jgi:hypothetical protein
MPGENERLTPLARNPDTATTNHEPSSASSSPANRKAIGFTLADAFNALAAHDAVIWRNRTTAPLRERRSGDGGPGARAVGATQRRGRRSPKCPVRRETAHSRPWARAGYRQSVGPRRHAPIRAHYDASSTRHLGAPNSNVSPCQGLVSASTRRSVRSTTRPTQAPVCGSARVSPVAGRRVSRRSAAGFRALRR